MERIPTNKSVCQSLILDAANKFPGRGEILCPDGCSAMVEQRPCPILEEIGCRVTEAYTRIDQSGHEIKTLLTPLQGYIDLMMRNPPKRYSGILGILRRHIQRLGTLVEDLGTATKPDKTEMTFHFGILNVADVLKETKTIFNVQRGSFRFICESPSDLPPILADRDRISQVMANLLSNAIKYSPSGGEIIVAAAAEECMVRFSVKDQGMGIAAEELPRVFRSYYRVKDPGMDGISGWGLGLAISKAIIEAHQGRIWAESLGRGHGSTFNFTIPVYNPMKR